MATEFGWGRGGLFLILSLPSLSSRCRNLLWNLRAKGALILSGLDTAGGGAKNLLEQRGFLDLSWCWNRLEKAAGSRNWSLSSAACLLGCGHDVSDVVEAGGGGSAQLVHE